MKAVLTRFSGSRLARILGWTTAAITWGAVALSSSVTDTDQSTVTPRNPVQPPPTPNAAERQQVESFPEEPEGGLVILRGIPVEDPEPVTVVRRVVVQSQSPSATPAPKTQESSGS